jgi:hypothetical protein
MVILLDFVQSWNDTWVEFGEEDVSWYYALLGETTVTRPFSPLFVSGPFPLMIPP